MGEEDAGAEDTEERGNCFKHGEDPFESRARMT
jgi:hypothetical protein